MLDLSRNWGLISPETQRKIAISSIFLAGCGLGARIAEIAVRTGFKNFIVADGDKVEASNLNRQPFFQHQLGKNKAETTRELIVSINPQANVQVIPHFLQTKEEITPLVERAHFVVNTVDPDETFWTLNEISRTLKKVELHPLNVGWWSFVYVSLPDDPPLQEILGGKFYGYELYRKLVALAPQISLPQPILEKMDEIVEGKLPFPQIAPTSAVTATLSVSAMIEWLENGELKENPIVVRIR